MTVADPAVIIDAKGLNTQPNELRVPAGSLAVAENVEVTRDGVVQVSPGFSNFSSNLPAFLPEQLFSLGGQPYTITDSGWWYHDGTNWLRKNGAYGFQFQPNRVAYYNSGLYFSDTYSVVYRLDLSTGTISILAGQRGVVGSTDGTGTAASFNAVRGIWSDGTGNFYVAEQAGRIRKITSAGVVTTFATGVTSAYGIWGTGVGGDFYVGCSDHVIRRVTSGGVVSVLAGTAGAPGTTDATGAAARFNSPLGIWGDGAGTLYVADSNNNSIRSVTYTGGVVSTFAGTSGSSGFTNATGTSARFNAPNDVFGDGSGSLYVTDNLNFAVRKVTYPGAVVTTYAGGNSGTSNGIGTLAQFSDLQGVTRDSSGHLHVVDSKRHRKIYATTLYVASISGTTSVATSPTPNLLADGIVVGPS